MFLRPIFIHLILCVFFASHFQADAQNQIPYRLNTAREVSLSLGGSLLVATSFLLKKNKETISPELIGKLDAGSINGFDRWATNNWSPKAAKMSDVLGYTTMALPAVFLFDKKVDRNFPVATAYFETFVITAGITMLTKELAKRKRPFVYNPQTPAIKKLQKDATASFFSGHTSLSAAASFFCAKVYTDHHPNSKFKPYAWSLAAAVPAVVALLRVRAGKHYSTDVMVGYAVGASIGFLIPHFHRNRNSEN